VLNGQYETQSCTYSCELVLIPVQNHRSYSDTCMYMYIQYTCIHTFVPSYGGGGGGGGVSCVVSKNQSSLYCPRPFALPTLLQYYWATFAQYMTSTILSLYMPYTIQYWWWEYRVRIKGQLWVNPKRYRWEPRVHPNWIKGALQLLRKRYSTAIGKFALLRYLSECRSQVLTAITSDLA